MIKKTFFTLFLVLLTTISYGQKIHFICFASTNDDTIGDGVSKNVNLMLDFVMSLATTIDMEERLMPAIVMKGDDCNPENLVSTIKDFRCGENDIVIFCYLGHGARGETDMSDFPQMCLGSINQADYIPLEYVKEAIVSKGPRFCLVLADCCNNTNSYILPKENLLVAAAGLPQSRSGMNGMKRLFLGYCGSIMVAGSKKGESAWVTKNEGGFFTNGFLKEMYSYTSTSQGSYDWNTLLHNMRTRVMDYSKTALKDIGGYVQTPIFMIEPYKNSGIIVGKFANGILDALRNLTDISHSPKQRITQYKEIIDCFARENSMIEQVGHDMRSVVAYMTASEYLMRLATVQDIADFTILEERKDANGRIKYLKIHEIYNKE